MNNPESELRLSQEDLVAMAQVHKEALNLPTLDDTRLAAMAVELGIPLPNRISANTSPTPSTYDKLPSGIVVDLAFSRYRN